MNRTIIPLIFLSLIALCFGLYNLLVFAERCETTIDHCLSAQVNPGGTPQ